MLTLKAWNANPSIVQKEIKCLVREVKELKKENYDIKGELRIVKNTLEDFKNQKKVALLDNRQMVEATLKAWNKNPSIVKKLLDEQA